MRDPRVALLLIALAQPATAQWTYTSSGTTAELRGLSIASSDGTIWASGGRGTVVRSYDGGKTWQTDTIAGATTLDFRAVLGFSALRAVVASAGEAEKGLAKMFTTRNGRTWEQVFSTDQRGVFLDAVAFWDARNGIALSDPVDSAFFLLTTTDGGASWTRIPPASLPRVLPGEAAFAASGSSMVVRGDARIWIGTGGGGHGRVMYSADRGRTWSVSDTPVHADGGAAGIFSLAFFDDRVGIAAGGDYTKPHLAANSVALTLDGGRTWAAAAAPPAAYLSGVSYAGSAQDVVAVGLAGTFVSRDGGQRWTQSDTVAMNSVRFRGTSGVAVGPRGRVAWMEGLPR
jgi:photosystem II stability/assembly factor-like uncharacterized protein